MGVGLVGHCVFDSRDLEDFIRIYLIKDQSRQDLGVKIGGFSGHDQAVAGHLFNMIHLGGIKEEGHLISAVMNTGDAFCHITLIMEDFFIIQVLFAETQASLKDES